MAQFIELTHDTAQTIIAHINDSKLIAFPTETVYGLGARIFDIHAIELIFRYKMRPQINPIIAHVSDKWQALELIKNFETNEDKFIFHKMFDEYMPGPLTVLWEKNSSVPDIVTAGSKYIGIRCPDHIIAQKLLSYTGPLVAPSANLSTHISPTSEHHVYDDFEDKDILIIKNVNDIPKYGIESTIIKFNLSEKKIFLLRYGGFSMNKLKELASDFNFELINNIQNIIPNKLECPGQMLKHYSPTKPTFRMSVNSEGIREGNISRVAIIDFGKTCYCDYGTAFYCNLSYDENLEEALRYLYAYMRKAEKHPNVESIYINDFNITKKLNDQWFHVFIDRIDKATAN